MRIGGRKNKTLRSVLLLITIMLLVSSTLYYKRYIYINNSLDKLVINKQSGTIKFWHLQDEDWQDKITAFNSIYPNLKIEEKKIENLEQYEKVLSENTSEANLVALPSTLWSDYYSKALDAPSSIINHRTVLKYVDSRIARELIGVNTVKGLMPSTTPLVMAVNQDLIKQYNITENSDTWDNILNICYKFIKQNGAKLTPGCIGLGGSNVVNGKEILLNLMLMNGANINLSNEINFNNNTDATVKAIDFYSSFSDIKKRNRSFSIEGGSDIEQFNNGNIAMVIIRPTQTKLLTIKNISYKIMPTTNKDFREQFVQGDILASLGGNNFNNWTFIKYINSSSALTLSPDGVIPTRKDLSPSKNPNIYKPLTKKIYDSNMYWNFWYSKSPNKVLRGLDQLLSNISSDKQELLNNLVKSTQ